MIKAKVGVRRKERRRLKQRSSLIFVWAAGWVGKEGRKGGGGGGKLLQGVEWKRKGMNRRIELCGIR